MREIENLIARLEEATGPDRQIDRLIEETLPGVLRHPHRDSVKDGYVISGDFHPTYGPGQGYLPKHYTAVIDDALTLAPEESDAEFSIEHAVKGPPLIYRAEIGASPLVRVTSSLAIAICIAALKARTELRGDQPATEGR